MMLRKIFAIAFESYQHNLRNKVLNVILLFAVIVIMSLSFFSFLAPSAESKFVKDVGLSSIMFFAVLLTIFGGAALIPDDIDQKTILNILSKPVRRGEYLLGRFLGTVLICSVNYLVMILIFLAVLQIREKGISLDLFKALFLTYCALLVLASIVIAISTRASAIVNVTISVVIYIVGNMTQYTLYLKERIISTFAQVSLDVLYYLVPNFDNFNVASTVILGKRIPLEYLAQNFLYAVLYITLMLAIGYLLFNDREI